MNGMVIKYLFELADGARPELEVRLDPATLLDLSPIPEPLPDWTRLGFHQCPNCPLDPAAHRTCPAAVRVADVIETFGALTSVDQVHVRVEGPERTTTKHTTLASGLASLLGLRLATSGCPVLAKLRPMARFHLPFANEDETLFRALATYLIGQLLRQQAGETADWSLQGLKETYAAIGTVNRAFATRMRAALSQDAGANALVKLDLFAKAIPMELSEWLKEFAPAFEAWK